MKKNDIVIPGILIGLTIAIGIFFLTEWQIEQETFNSLSEEDKAMTLLAENLRKTSKTNCTELSQILNINTNQIMIDAIHMKQKELGC